MGDQVPRLLCLCHPLTCSLVKLASGLPTGTSSQEPLPGFYMLRCPAEGNCQSVAFVPLPSLPAQPSLNATDSSAQGGQDNLSNVPKDSGGLSSPPQAAWRFTLTCFPNFIA